MNKSQEEKIQESILETLAKLSGQRVGTDQIHKEGTRYQLPEVTTLPEDIKFLIDYAEAQETETTFTNTFRFRPWDGAHAFQAALMRTWGTSGRGVAQRSFFGSNPPQMRTIYVGPDQTAQVPWGTIQFAPLQATIDLGATMDREFGLIFVMSVTAAKKHAAQVDGLFKLVEHELQTNSIYKGKAFTGAEEPHFLDPFTVDRDRVVYTAEVNAQLRANIWTLLEQTDVCRSLGLPLKRAILLGGPYGTGKSMAAMITAQIAITHNWSFIQCRPEDDLKRTLQTARLYQPSVVFYEDVDKLTLSGDPEAISKLLDMFDGIQTKGTELAMVLTTNHVNRIHKGMLRPGRLDGMVDIGALDRESFERLVKAIVPEGKLDPAIDFDQVSEAMTGFLPAFVKEAIDRAMFYSVSRVGGKAEFFTTEDFVHAARGLRPQLDRMREAHEGITPDALDAAMQKVVTKVIAGGDVGIYDRDKQHRFTLASVDSDDDQ
jgi:transitional endoplasmic reticulum ATPase